MITLLSLSSVFSVLRETKLSSERVTRERSDSSLGRVCVSGLFWGERVCVCRPRWRDGLYRPQTRPPIAVNPLFRERGLTETRQPCPNHCNLIHHISMMKMTHQHFIRSLSVLMGNIVLKALEKIDVPISKTVDGDFMHSRGHNWPQDTN